MSYSFRVNSIIDSAQLTNSPLDQPQQSIQKNPFNEKKGILPHIFPLNIWSLYHGASTKQIRLTLVDSNNSKNYSNFIYGHQTVDFERAIQQLKQNRSLEPEDLRDAMKRLGLNDSETQYEVIRCYLERYPEAMLLKLDSFPALSLEQKLELFETALVYDPSLVNSWRAAFPQKVRKSLADMSRLCAVLEKFNEMKKEADTIQEVLVLLKSQWPSDIVAIVEQFLEKIFHSNEYFLQKRDLAIWIAFAFDRLSQLALTSVEDANKSLRLMVTLSKFDSLKFLVAALFFDSEYFSLLQKAFFVVDISMLLSLIGDLFSFAEHERVLFCRLSREEVAFTLSTILRLSLSALLSEQQKKHLLHILYRSSNEKELLLSVTALEGLLGLKDPEVFKKLPAHPEDLQNLFLKALQNLHLLIASSDIPGTIQHYFQTFASLQVPNALIQYAKCLHNLALEEEKIQVLNTLRELCEDVFHGEFLKKRYDTMLSPHLKTIFASFPDLKEPWSKNSIKMPIDEKLLEELPTEEIKGCIVLETDSLEDLFLCTTKVSGSCLSIFGNCEDNKAFLAYVVDGKNKLFCIKDAKGNMIGRAIVRLLWNAENKTPALLLETFYSSLPYKEGKNGISSSYEQLEKSILKAAIAKASSLGLPLLKAYSSHDLKHPVYPHAIASLGGRAPIECCDAVGASGMDEICPKSVFKIAKAQILFSP